MNFSLLVSESEEVEGTLHHSTIGDPCESDIRVLLRQWKLETLADKFEGKR